MRLFSVREIVAACLLAAGLAVVGCESKPNAQTSWSARVGTYTYSQALIDLGPPTTTTKLADGSTVARWAQSGHPTDNTFTFTSTAAAAASTNAPPAPEPGKRYLSLTFDANNVLSAWEKRY